MEHGAIRSFRDLFDAIEEQLQNQRHLPALILIYSTIDSVSWLTARDISTKGVRQRFEFWTEKWILPSLPIKCSSTELYAARCAILHTFTSHSDLSLRGDARRVVYAYGAASTIALQNKLNSEAFVVVHVQELYSAVKEAIDGSLKNVLLDEMFSKTVDDRLHNYFGTVDGDEADDCVR